MSRSQPNPWPLKWVAIIIIACLGAYTIFTLATLDARKTAKNTHEPYAEYQARKATAQRLETVGYKLIGATTERPASPGLMDEAMSRFRPTITSAPAGIPFEVAAQLTDQPNLPDTFSKIAAPATATPNEAYQILYTCELPDDQKLLGNTSVYIKGDDVIVVTHFNRLDGDLHARTKETAVLLTLPAGTFAAGRSYTITLAGRNESRRWTLLTQ